MLSFLPSSIFPLLAPFSLIVNHSSFIINRFFRAKADAKIKVFIRSLQIFPHIFSNFFSELLKDRLIPRSLSRSASLPSPSFQPRPFPSILPCRGAPFRKRVQR